ncbi:MAG TPA: hypothetical protein VMF31_07405 [Solirubrobacterales bacterium]|nr:hypothetical protein [Solirubrobacterales bacterium]
MDFKKLGQQVGRLKQQAEDKLGDRIEPENLKRDGKQLRDIMSGDGSLAEKAKEAKAKLSDPDRGDAAESAEAAGTSPAEASGTPENSAGDTRDRPAESGQ